LVVVAVLAGCGPAADTPERVWGRRGVQDGDLVRPRALAIDPADRLFVVDFTARIQVYSLDGKYLGPTWQTPDYRNGRPSGLGVDRTGQLIVCDSHYHLLRFYAADGTEQRTLGGQAGSGSGEFGYVSDIVEDAEGYFYVSEFGQNERLTKLDAQGQFVQSWGSLGTGPGQFNRPRALALGPDGLLYVADACNHRVQVFTRDGQFVRQFGEPGEGLGQLSYPYDLAFAPAGQLYVVERGNNRVQKFTPTGTPLGVWGSGGKRPGQFSSPWAIAIDRWGRIFVADTENHRIQRFRF
jgi:DNA-binding beta-propeller fold protein YncE